MKFNVTMAAKSGVEREHSRPVGTHSPVNPAGEAGWGTFLESTHATIFHSAAWSEVLQETYGFSPRYLVKRKGDSISAALPLMEVNSWLTGRRGVSLPFTDECEALGSDDEIQSLIQESLELGRSQGWKHLEFRGSRRFFGEAKASVKFYGHEIDLSGGEAALSERLESSVRRSIRKAEKTNLKLEFSDSSESVKAFYELLCLTRQRHGMPPQPYHFFEQIHRHILSKGHGRVVLARLEGRPVAGAVYLSQGDRAIYKFGASDEVFQELRGNNLVMWNAIKWHSQNGFKSLHLGKTSLTNEGLRRFKLGWGAAESVVEYFKYDFRINAFVEDRDEASGWHNQIFKVMPRGVARLVGTGLYRHWA